MLQLANRSQKIKKHIIKAGSCRILFSGAFVSFVNFVGVLGMFLSGLPLHAEDMPLNKKKYKRSSFFVLICWESSVCS